MAELKLYHQFRKKKKEEKIKNQIEKQYGINENDKIIVIEKKHNSFNFLSTIFFFIIILVIVFLISIFIDAIRPGAEYPFYNRICDHLLNLL